MTEDRLREAGDELHSAAHHAAACLVDIRDAVELPEKWRAAVEANVHAVGLAMARWQAATHTPDRGYDPVPSRDQ